MLTPVTTVNSGRLPESLQPLRNPAAKAPFGPPPEIAKKLISRPSKAGNKVLSSSNEGDGMMARPLAPIALNCLILAVAARSSTAQPDVKKPDRVLVAAVQILGYDKTDVPKPGYDPMDSIIPYIHKAGSDGAQLVVFPEYVLGLVRWSRPVLW